MARDVRKHPSTFAEPIEGIGLVRVGADSTTHEWDHDALRSKLIGAVTEEAPTRAAAVEWALRCAPAGWRVTGLRALGIDVERYRTTTHGTPKARIE